MPPDTFHPLTLWRFLDGKPGHEKQSLGLCQALARHTPTRQIDLPVEAGWKSFLRWATGRSPRGRDLPSPDLLIGAGHATHLPMLAARRAHGGRIVVLMRPSLPLALFDLCLIPEHDAPPSRPGVLSTVGVLNPLTASGTHAGNRGLILVGGPSPHFHWDSPAIIRQIGELAHSRTEMRWTLTTSRRTPAGFLTSLEGLPLEVHRAQATPAGWLESQLARAGEVWVTPDSVSMLYEALTAGCRVGLLHLPAVAGSRVARGVEGLRAKGLVAVLPHVPRATASLDEAGRSARFILERWFA
ncbi:MAG TPA: mitochondrial fission ELM1 family protein [Thiobacillaceae bacterium]|nr:mitochondrial fission ELM1 family protein [Thiobacillaceae bacterium]HNU63928.1 mitochondrial fission ELM1 family protein [Thiobacillaceae bacterium]